jgi:hypothetical protein
MPGLDPIGAKIRSDVSRMRCSASDSEAVHRWSGTVAKAVCVAVPGLQRIIPLRFMLRSARDTPSYFVEGCRSSARRSHFALSAQAS